jgi:negative regulator of flagellin synthesis FlgM
VGKGDRKAPGVGVTVSSQTRALERSDNTSDIDNSKVNAVRQSIEQKSFVVNAEAIADKLLANAREMLDRSKG